MENGCLFGLYGIIEDWLLRRINGVGIDGVRIGLSIAIFAALSSVIFQLGHWAFPAASWVLLTRNIWAGVLVLGLVLAMVAWVHK